MNLAQLRSKGLIGSVNVEPATDAEFPYGLGTQGLHEVVDEAFGDRAAATGFVFTATKPIRQEALFWISQASTRRNLGCLSEAALQEMTRRQICRISLTTRNSRDALWAAEEAVISGTVSHVIAEVDEADFTATRGLHWLRDAMACP